MRRNEGHELLESLVDLPFVKAEALNVEKAAVSKDEAAESVRKLWNWVIVKKVEELYKPVWHAVLACEGKAKNFLIDGVNGKILQ